MKERIWVRLGAETVLVFGPESVSYERSQGIDRCILREISARVFFVKIQKIKKNQISNISRISGNWKIQFPIFPGYEKLEKTRFPVFPGYEKII